MLQHLTKRLIALALSAALAIAPVAAQQGVPPSGGENMGWWSTSYHFQPRLFAATCNALATDLTTYTHSSIAIPGVTDAMSVHIAVIAMGEDGAATFGVNSVSVDSVALTQRTDEDGTGVVNAAIFSTDGPQTSAASVDVSVTYSEAVTGSVVCVYAFQNMSGAAAQSWNNDDDTASGNVVLTLASTSPYGFAIGGCINSGVADSTTWAGLTEREDTQSAEYDYSNADVTTTSTTLTVGCDWSGGNDASGASLALVPNWPPPTASIFLTATTSSTAASDANGTYSHASVAIGPAHPSRYIIVGCVAYDSANTFSLSSVTIGGVTATTVVGGNDLLLYGSISIAKVPTGTTATITHDYSEAIANAGGCTVWAAYNLKSETAIDTASDFNPTDNLTLNNDTQAGGIIVAYTAWDFDDGTDISWSGASGIIEDAQVDIESGNPVTGGASIETPATASGAAVTRVGNPNGSSSVANLVASFR